MTALNKIKYSFTGLTIKIAKNKSNSHSVRNSFIYPQIQTQVDPSISFLFLRFSVIFSPNTERKIIEVSLESYFLSENSDEMFLFFSVVSLFQPLRNERY